MNEWQVEYHEKVVRDDLRHIDRSIWRRLRETIESHYAQMSLPGKALSHELRSYRTLRIGDWRAICRLKGTALIVYTVRHRSKGYGPDLIKVLKRRDF